jgi:hypothetical protein
MYWGESSLNMDVLGRALTDVGHPERERDSAREYGCTRAPYVG